MHLACCIAEGWAAKAAPHFGSCISALPEREQTHYIIERWTSQQPVLAVLRKARLPEQVNTSSVHHLLEEHHTFCLEERKKI